MKKVELEIQALQDKEGIKHFFFDHPHKMFCFQASLDDIFPITTVLQQADITLRGG